MLFAHVRTLIRIRPLLPFFGLACLFALSASIAEAAGTREAVRQSVENSMRVTGTIDVGINGKVTAHQLDQPDKLPPVVRELAAKAVPSFRFEPVMHQGMIVKARVKMGLRVVARQQADGNYSLRLASASFGSETPIAGEEVTSKRLVPPSYPVAAYAAGVTGTVFLVVKVDRTGAVEDVVAEQTNLTVVGTERQIKMGRETLEKASIAAARSWRFVAPTKGAAAAEPFWMVRVPVEYRLWSGPSSIDPKYGQWQSYVPGPKQRVPWFSEEENRRNPDAMLAGMPHMVGSGPKLLTPLGG